MLSFLTFRKKPIYELNEEDSSHSLNRTLGVKDLTMLGIAAVIGAGIFSTIGFASFHGGPAVSLLFVLIAITCGFSALCYAEFASRVPQSGSAYTYAYVTFGEIFAWIIGWALILEYAIGNIVVAISWSGYFNNLLQGLGIHLPYWMTTGYFSAEENVQHILELKNKGEAITPAMQQTLVDFANVPTLLDHKILLNFPALCIVVLITWIALIGIKESKNFSNAMVLLKLMVIFLVIGVGFFYVKPENWSPFMPNGFSGVLQGVSAIFFAYIGFDAISTTAEECKNPQKDLPKGMILSLVICTVLYILISLVLTGVVSYKELKVDDPLAYIFEALQMNWMSYIISISAVIATTSVLLVFQIGQPRIWMNMSRDGLLPKKFSSIHAVYKTPAFATLITGILVGIPALFLPISLVTDLTSIGTLFAFILVCLGVLALPKIKKEKHKFSIPYLNSLYVMPIVLGIILIVGYYYFSVPESMSSKVFYCIYTFIFLGFSVVAMLKKYNAIPVLGTLSCLYLLIEIPIKGWIGFIIWMLLGSIIYVLYGFTNSKNKKITQ